MDDAEYEHQKARIQALIERWLKPLGLHWGRTTFIYERDSGEFQRLRDEHCGDNSGLDRPAVAFCTADWRYGQASIYFNMLVVAGEDDDVLEEYFVHELMHIFLSEMREEGRDHEERVATTLAKAFLWLRDHLAEQQSDAPIPTEVTTC